MTERFLRDGTVLEGDIPGLQQHRQAVFHELRCGFISKKICSGVCPVMRDDEPAALPGRCGTEIRARVDEILQGTEHIELADAAPLPPPDGMLWDNADVEKVAAFSQANMMLLTPPARAGWKPSPNSSQRHSPGPSRAAGGGREILRRRA